jgi:predicted DNA-binding transcriptional regulator YafY
MQYRRGGDGGAATQRVVDPLGVVLKAGAWYLVGRRDGETRTYRVSRIDGLALLDRFERPDDFDLAAYWDRSVAAYADGLPRFAARLRIRGAGVEQLVQVIGDGPTRQALAAASEPDQEGWRTVSITLEEEWYTALNLLRLGPDAEILDPPELREHVAAAARAMAAVYG